MTGKGTWCSDPTNAAPRVSQSARPVIDYLYFFQIWLSQIQQTQFSGSPSFTQSLHLGLTQYRERERAIVYSCYELRCTPQKGKKIINWAKKSYSFSSFSSTYFHQPSTWFDLTLNYGEFPSFFSLLTHFFPDGVHNKTTLFLFVAALLHTLILLPTSPVPSSPRLALLFSVFNHCLAALFALSLSYPAAHECAQRELHCCGLSWPQLQHWTRLWESARQNGSRAVCHDTANDDHESYTSLHERDDDRARSRRRFHSTLNWDGGARWAPQKISNDYTATTFRTDESKIKRK